MLLSKSARCERIQTEIARFLERKRVVSSRRAKVVLSSVNDSKERLAVTTAIRGDKETCRKR